jgi:hypothetical protein
MPDLNIIAWEQGRDIPVTVFAQGRYHRAFSPHQINNGETFHLSLSCVIFILSI